MVMTSAEMKTLTSETLHGLIDGWSHDLPHFEARAIECRAKWSRDYWAQRAEETRRWLADAERELETRW